MNEGENDEGVNLADPDSLLGLLQRGRGKGYLMALDTPPRQVWPLLLECITNDPQLDRQWRPDREYYVSLILKTGMDLEPLASFVRQNDAQDDDNSSNVDFTLWVLERLAQRDNSQAWEFLREYLRHGCDFRWIAFVVHDLAEMGALDGVDEILYSRINADQDSYGVFRKEVEEDWRRYCRSDEDDRRKGRFLLPMCEPWKSLCRKHGGLAGLFTRVGLPYDCPPAVCKVTDADVAGLSIKDLLALVDKASFLPSKRAMKEKASAQDEDCLLANLSSVNKYRVRLAFRGLGTLGTPRAFEAVASFLESSENADSGVRGEALDAMWRLPSSLTLAMARQWFLREKWYLQSAAGGVFERHATLEDIPLLMQILRTPGAIQNDDYRLSFILTTLTRFEGLGRIPELEQVFCETPDPFRRGDAAEAMAATAPGHFTAEYAYECLWDCDWAAFKMGCAMVDLSTPGAIERLKEIAADECESDDTREIAKKRLESIVG